MKVHHSIFEVMFFIGLVLVIIPFFAVQLFPIGIVLGLVLMLLSAARERMHLLKHK